MTPDPIKAKKIPHRCEGTLKKEKLIIIEFNSRHSIGTFYYGQRYVLATLMVCHCIDQMDHCVGIFKSNLDIWSNTHLNRHMVDVFLGLVLCGRSPCADYGGDGLALVVVDIAPEQNEGCTEPVIHGYKLLKVWVGGVVNLAEPYVPDANV